MALSLFVWPWVAAFHSHTVAGHVFGGIYAGLEVALVAMDAKEKAARKEAMEKALRASGTSAPPTSKEEQVQKTAVDDLPPYCAPES
jgi:hypothetical protein